MKAASRLNPSATPSSSTSLPDLQPTSDVERHAILDVLRGFALYGVLLANLVWLTTDMVLTDARLQQLPTATVDPIAQALVVFFIDGKFYTLFAFLFGLWLLTPDAAGRDTRRPDRGPGHPPLVRTDCDCRHTSSPDLVRRYLADVCLPRIRAPAVPPGEANAEARGPGAGARAPCPGNVHRL